jgi:hypothetical protein
LRLSRAEIAQEINKITKINICLIEPGFRIRDQGLRKKITDPRSGFGFETLNTVGQCCSIAKF